MKSKRSKRFHALFAELPESVQRQANEAYRLFRANPSHPSLSFKQVSPNGPVYSVRVGLHYRALAIRQPDCLLWFWIGSHADYDKMLARL
jgi:hypothetical protein